MTGVDGAGPLPASAPPSLRSAGVPLVSVVVPTHQRVDLLPRLLASVLGQDLTDLELLVVDDGCTDGTRQLLESCADPRLRVLSHPRALGVASARNTGTAAARGRWVAWCDDDDVWNPAKLRLQVQALEATPGALWSNGGSAYVDSDLRLSRVRRCPAPATIATDMLRINAVTGGGSGVLADRELVLSLGGFDTRLSMYADWDLWARLAHAAPLAAVDHPLVGYVEHVGGMSRGRLHLALDELSLLQESLERLRERSGHAQGLDAIALGHWMLRQQTGGGRRRDRAALPFRLLQHGLLRPRRVLPYSLLTAFAPSALERRWASRWCMDERYVREAQAWLGTLRAGLPATATP